jgi:hypothetical protein
VALSPPTQVTTAIVMKTALVMIRFFRSGGIIPLLLGKNPTIDEAPFFGDSSVRHKQCSSVLLAISNSIARKKFLAKGSSPAEARNRDSWCCTTTPRNNRFADNHSSHDRTPCTKQRRWGRLAFRKYRHRVWSTRVRRRR